MNINFQGLLQSTCSVLGFEVGEVWFARKQIGKKYFFLFFLFFFLFSFSHSFVLLLHFWHSFSSHQNSFFHFISFFLSLSIKGTKKVLLRFHQLHISSIYEEDRKALIKPNGFEVYSDESDHKASPFVRYYYPILFSLKLIN